MKDLNDMTNNEILMEIKNLQVEHEVVKLRMLKDYEILETVEKRFTKANEELVKRMRGEK